MQISRLEVFCEVADQRSISKAAKKLHLAQPAVSAQVRALEEELGTRLLERHSRGVALTRAGTVVYEFARQILTAQTAMLQAVGRVIDEENMNLRLAASFTVGSYALPCSIWTFKQKYPETTVRLEIASTGEVGRRVRDGLVDLGVVEGPFTDEELAKDRIFSDDLVLITSAAESWARADRITPEELRDAPLILREPGSGVREAIEMALAGGGLSAADLKVTSEMFSNDAVKSAVEAGLGVSVMPRLCVQRDLKLGLLRAVEIEVVGGRATIDFFLIHRPDVKYGTAARRFMEFMRAEGASTLS